jgi:hypothetical protein
VRQAAAVTILALACAASAAALTIHSGTVAVPAGKRGTVITTCPPPTRAMFLGVKATVDEKAELELTSLGAGGRRAVASAVNLERPGTGTLTVFAYCGRRPVRRTLAASTTVGPQKQASVTAVCPPKTSVLFGGFRAEVRRGGPEVTLNGLERVSARRWQVSAVNLEGPVADPAGKLTAIAYCTPGSPKLVAGTKSVKVPYGKTKAVTASCPSGKTLALGGFRSTHYTDRFASIYPASLLRTGSRTWTVSGHKFVPAIGKLTAIAYCR